MKATNDLRLQIIAAQMSLLKCLETNEPSEMALHLAAAGSSLNSGVNAMAPTFPGFRRQVERAGSRSLVSA